MIKRPDKRVILLVTLHCSLVTLLGCESLQKKFVRKSKPHARESPVISFQDYTRTMTPLDRYRKHYVLFEYWNQELLDALEGHAVSVSPITGSGLNPKQAKQASRESLKELQVLQGLLQDDKATQVAPIIDERRRIDQHIQQGLSGGAPLDAMRQRLEAHTRQINRTLFWRHVEDSLKDADGLTPSNPD